MTNILNTRILLSGATILAAAAVIIGATFAFFSDTETSSGNTLAAGAIDLTIDNESYVTGPDGNLIESPDNSWELSDLTNQLFFSFNDIKPGDIGEDTISIHVNDNDAWVCAAARVTEDSDVSYTEPELEDDPTVDENDPEGTDGELAENLNFAFWADDGDNVLETDEVESIFVTGPASNLDENGGVVTLVDSELNRWSGQAADPLEGESTAYVGKAWCFGELSADPVAEGDGDPIQRGTGFDCDGASELNNAAQTDRVVGDFQFYAEQSRNNPDFTCAENYTPGWEDENGEGEEVGALLSSYVQPSCNVTVSDNESIQAAVGSAGEDATICVDSSYTGSGDTFPVNLNVEGQTIAGVGSVGDAEIPGGFFVDANDVTITGLEFTDYSFIAASENAAVYIHNEDGQGSGTALTDTTITHNIFTAPNGAKGAEAKGIVTEIGSGATPAAADILVSHNVFDGWRQAMFFNTARDYVVSFNDILNNDVGVANDGPHDASIHHNDFDSNVLEAVGIAPSADNGTGNNGLLSVNTNNLTPAGAGNDVNWYGSSVQGGADVDATNNFWDDEAEGVRTNDTSEVDTSSPVLVAFPEN